MSKVNEIQLDSDEVLHLAHLVRDHANNHGEKSDRVTEHKLLSICDNNVTFTLRKNEAQTDKVEKGDDLMQRQYTSSQYCENYEVAAKLLNGWPATMSTDDLLACIDHFQIVPTGTGKQVVVFILWREVPKEGEGE